MRLNTQISIIGIKEIPLVSSGDDLSALIVRALDSQGEQLLTNDILVVTQKVVSIAEGRVVSLSDIDPSPFAMQLGQAVDRDPRHIEVVLRESNRIVRSTKNVLLTESRHGYICANSGVDQSNIEEGKLVLLPKDPDASARTIRKSLERHYDVPIAVVISDTFGRPWRMGQTNVAIGSSGISVFADYRGQDDQFGNRMDVTQIAIVDELASAAELVMGKINRVPVAIIRNYKYAPAEEPAARLIRPKEKDLFI